MLMAFLRGLSRFVVAPLLYFIIQVVLGWRIVGSLPDVPKMVTAVAPHTSNLDFFFILYLSAYFKKNPSWLGKQELFANPIMKRLLIATGGIPVDRDSPLKATKQVVKAVAEKDEIVLVLAPDGTRKYTDHWKKGFYFIAHKTKLPLVFIKIDYGTKLVTVREPMYTTGNAEADIDLIRPFYEGVKGRNPENMSLIRLED